MPEGLTLGCRTVLSVSFFVSLSLVILKLLGNSLSKPRRALALVLSIASLRTKFVGQGETQLLGPFVFLELLPNLSIKKQPRAGS